MKYKLTEKPEIVDDSEKIYRIIDEQGNKYSVSKVEQNSGTELYIWNGAWNPLVGNKELEEYMWGDDVDHDEYEFDLIDMKEDEKKMEQVYEEFVKTNGEINDFRKLHDLIEKLSSPIRGDYYNRFYDAYHFAYNKLRK